MAIDVPKPMRRNTGETKPAYEAMERFFSEAKDEVQRRLDYDDSSRPTLFEIHRYELQNGSTQRDDKAHYLTFSEIPVAVVLETRTNWNFVSFTFFENIEAVVKANEGKVFK